MGHRSIASIRVRKRGVTEVERDIDRFLCSVLGIEGLDAIRTGRRRQRIESLALLMTGLSAPELMRAKRLRDSGRLQRQDLLDMLSGIDQMVATDSNLSDRQEVWDRLRVIAGLE